MNTPVPTSCADSIVISGQRICGKLVGINTIGDLVNRVITVMFPLAGIILFLVLVWGGFDVLTSAGNPEKLKSGQGKITAGLVGFGIIVFAYGITRLITFILGFQGFF